MKDPLLEELGALAREQARAPELELSPAADAALRERAIGELLRGATRKPEVEPKRKRRGFWLAGAGGVALAASIFFVLRAGVPAPLPEYESAFEGGQGATRGSSTGSEAAGASPITIPPGARVSFVFRPRTRVGEAGALLTRAFVEQAGVLRELEARPEVSEEGAVRLSGTREAVFGDLPAGAFRLHLLVGWKPQLAGDEATMGALIRRPPTGVRAAHQDIILTRD